jgi:bifunctional oligoribonuclease and PAP phosphatase NrnA
MVKNQNYGESLNSLNSIITKASNITIISHMNPDGDAIGSVLGMGMVLEKIEKKVTILSPNMFPLYLKWLPGSKNIIVAEHHKEKAREALEKAEVIICMDFNEPKRIGFLSKTLIDSKGKKILIDHHPDPADIFDLVFSNTEKSSTAELAFQILSDMQMEDAIDKNAAACFFSGILTDTGCFCHSSNQPGIFITVAKLIEKGIDKDKIKQKIFNNYTEKRMRLLGKLLYENMVVLPEYHTAYTFVTAEEMEIYNYESGDSEGFVNFPLDIKNVVFSVFLTEYQDRIKLSFRSKGNFPSNEVARKYFDGGGHFNASGGESLLNLEETINKFVALLPEYKEALKNTYLKNMNESA